VLGCYKSLAVGKLNWIYYLYHYLFMSRDSAVGIATGYGLNDRGVGVQVPVGSRIFPTSSRPAKESTKPPIQWVPRALSSEVKRQGRENDHSSPASAEFKKIWIYTSTLPYALQGQIYLFTLPLSLLNELLTYVDSVNAKCVPQNVKFSHRPHVSSFICGVQER
jgi:hypothetical protein